METTLDVTTSFEKHLPTIGSRKVLLAFSSGVDSSVLAFLCHYYHIDFSMAHVNYRLRGLASEKDQFHADKISTKYNVKLHTNTSYQRPSSNPSPQTTARDHRYKWFSELKSNYGYPLTLTAHHLDDAMETFIMNAVRGTGIDGLKGIPSAKETYRPLIALTKSQILAFARLNNLDWREDPSNETLDYLRNRIRKSLLPPVKKEVRNYEKGFQKTIQNVSDQAHLLEIYGESLRKRLISDDLKITIKDLENLTPLDIHLPILFKPFGKFPWHDLHSIIYSSGGKYVCSRTFKVTKVKSQLQITAIGT